jgi:2-hydroxy-3-keto-5-methylthiopentenyl-1-phosphate phosphatase
MTDDAGSSPPPAGGPLGHLLALLDYDGTATTRECNEVVLQRFAGDAWRPFEDLVHGGRMSHAECFDRQIGLIDAPRAELIGALVTCAEPAPGLDRFLTALREGGGRAVIVSAGLREAIEEVWRSHALPPLELVASELEDRDGDDPFHARYGVRFSDRLGFCPDCGPDACKAAVLRELRRPGDVVWVFGDGASDLCPAREADLIWARGYLAERAAAEGLPWRPLDFTAAAAALTEVKR